MTQMQIKNTQIKAGSLKNEQIAADAAISLSKIAGGVALQTAVSDLQNDAFVTREVPSGVVNGSNAIFTLANTPVAGSEQVYLNGLLQDPGAGNSYTISGGTITFASAPLSGDEIHVSYATGDYMVAPGGGGAGAVEIFQDGEFTWSGPTTRTVSHNKGKNPDFVKVFVKTQGTDDWAEHYDLMYVPNGTPYGYNVTPLSDNQTQINLYYASGGATFQARIRLYWLSTQDVGTASAGNVAGVGGSGETYEIAQFTHPAQAANASTAYTITHNLNTIYPTVNAYFLAVVNDLGAKNAGWMQIPDFLITPYSSYGHNVEIIDANSIRLVIFNLGDGPRQIRGAIKK